MKTLYFECNMGASGDMITSALLELVSPEQQQEYLRVMNSLSGISVSMERVRRCGVDANHVTVLVNGKEEQSHDLDEGHSETKASLEEHAQEHHHHHHAGMAEIEAIIKGLPVPDGVKDHALYVYRLIAQAESKAHGLPVEQVHFHEVGALDAVADVTGVCLLLSMIRPERVVVSPIHLGSGQVRCAHGILPVPAPATANILQGVPCYGGTVQGELCTPTGAAILKSIAQAFGPMPQMTLQAVGVGSGSKEFVRANILRIFMGESRPELQTSQVVELSCNLDDMTGEELAFAARQLWEGGALDVYSLPLQMKKGRAGVMLCCLCEVGNQAKLTHLMLEHTTSWGVRMLNVQRAVLPRKIKTVNTPYGAVRVKYSQDPIAKVKAEYEDAAAAAQNAIVSIQKVERAALKSFENEANKRI